LQLDDAKTPSRPFTLRCPQCQAAVNVSAPAEPNQASASEPASQSATITARTPFARPATAPPFNLSSEHSDPSDASQNTGLNSVAKLLAEAMHHADTGSTRSRGRKRPAWDRRKVLVCSSPAYREAIAQSLAGNDYEVFVAENMEQALGRMREERMDIVVLDANFDPVEQGVAFVTREVRLLRPAERRRLFFVYLTSGVRTMDLHAAFLHNVNLVVNPSDVDQLTEALEVSIRHYNELYRDFNRVLDVAPI